MPDEAYAAALIDGSSAVAAALLGPQSRIDATAILGGAYAADGNGDAQVYASSATFDFQSSNFAKGSGSA